MNRSLKFFIAGSLMFFGTCATGQDKNVELARFNEADSDGDGELSLLEFRSYVEAKLPMFEQFELLAERLDSDRNDTISPEEFGRRRDVVKEVMADSTPEPMEFADGFNLRFLKQKPLVGDTIGDLVAFDENGEELDFASLRGMYTVFNFGCLT